MSDDYFHLIATDPYWQPPSEEAALAAVEFVSGLFAAPGDAVEHVEYKYYDHVAVIDAGGLTQEVTCPRCGCDVKQWFWDLVTQRHPNFDDLTAQVPCCGAPVPLNEIDCDSPIGFARFEVSVMNPTRAEYELSTDELAHVAVLLGHPVTQILAHL